MSMHPEANNQDSTTADKLDELFVLAKLVGQCFDSIAKDDDGKLIERLTREEEQQLTELSRLMTRVTRQINETTTAHFTR